MVTIHELVGRMAFKKYQSVEKAQVASPSDHKKIESGLRSIGKTSAHSLSEEERRKALGE